MIKVIVNGCNGKMGREVIEGILGENDLELVGQTGKKDDLPAQIRLTQAQVVVDFTTPSVVYNNIKSILENGAYAVVGTTGLDEAQKAEINRLANQNGLGVLISPNFCIGAVLMMKFAAEAAKYMPNVEVVEYHHDEKTDAPSGTAIKTAEYINSIVGTTRTPGVESSELLGAPSRGAQIGNIRIHAVRLPGFVASQEVILGDSGQTLKIRHDTIDRKSFIPGVLLGIRKIVCLKGLVYGLENIL